MATAPRRLSGKKYGYDVDAIQAGDDTTFTGDNTFSGTTTFSGSVVGVGDVTQAGNNTFTGTNDFTGATVTGVGDVTEAGNNTFTGDNSYSGTETFTGTADFTGATVNGITSGISKGQISRYIFANFSVTTTILLGRAPIDCTVTKISMAFNTTLTDSETNYWTFSASVDTNNDGTGTIDLLAVDNANTSNGVGGANDWNASIFRDLVLTSTTANLDLTAGDKIYFTATETGGAPNAVQPYIILEYIPR